MRTLVALALTVTLASSGCSRGRARARIGVALPADTSAFLHAVEQEMRRVADSLELDLEVRADAGDAAHQAADVGALVDHRVSALVLVPVSPRGLGAAIAPAHAPPLPLFPSVPPPAPAPAAPHTPPAA